MRWYLKCMLDTAKALVPGQSHLRNLKRRWCAYTSPPSRTDFAIEEGIRLIQAIRSSREIRGSICLEIGAGWEPVLPLLFSLCGAQKVIMTDLHRLCTGQTVAAAIEGVNRNKDSIARELDLSSQFLSTQLKWQQGQGMDEFLREFRIEYLAPSDCTNLPLARESVDIIYSRAVLEHIPAEVLNGIFAESTRVLAGTGVACHFIDCSDHWEHNDKKISRINFLKHSDGLHRWTCINPMNYQNRLRHSEYVCLLHRSGLTILKEQRNVDAASLQLLGKMTLAARYRHFQPEDIATVDSFLLARKSETASSPVS